VPIGPGTHLGQYVVQDYIGEGAMGVVYRAYHPQLERHGAVKVLQSLGADAESGSRFRREAQAIAHLRHPNIVNVFDFGDYEGTPYMIVEYVEGGNLADRLRGGKLDHARAVRYLRQIGEAIDYAHSRGIVHRDIKPANVLMTNMDVPILADFGLVKLMLSSSIKSATGVATGTPAYMAPEQVAGGQVGPASDRYSFAIVAYQMLTGRIPFDQGGVLEIMYAQVNQKPPAPSEHDHDLGPSVDAVIVRGMAKEPAARWKSCGEMVDALEAALAEPVAAAAPQQTVVMRPPMPGGVVPPSPFQSPATTAAMAPPPSNLPELQYVPGHAGRIRKNRGSARGWLWLLAAALLIMVLGVGGYLVYFGLQNFVI
jgi:serine/threonine protein kinase